MKERSKAPGTCVQCGSDAYIRLAGQKGGEEMVCAHCFVDRVRPSASSKDRPSPDVEVPRS